MIGISVLVSIFSVVFTMNEVTLLATVISFVFSTYKFIVVSSVREMLKMEANPVNNSQTADSHV